MKVGVCRRVEDMGDSLAQKHQIARATLLYMGKAPSGEKQISGIERCYPSMVLEVISVYIRILLKTEDSFTPKVQIITAIMYLISLEATGPSLRVGVHFI